MQNACDKTNTLPKMKNCAECTMMHTLPCIEYSTRNKQRKSKKIKRKKILWGDLQ